MEEKKILLANAGKISPSGIDEYISVGGFGALKKALTKSDEFILNQIIDSGLRGRGGAGFPTGSKMKFAAQNKAPEKFVVCNADEGEPGTFKDRALMEQMPYLFLEGLMIAGRIIGAAKGFVYLRGEYFQSRKMIENAITQMRKKKILGKNIWNSNFTFDIELVLGAGSYLCGEELTLLESLEGKRGHPRIKPPFPAEKGFKSMPTLVNNVETLANLPHIVMNGPNEFRKYGTEKSPGTKIITISGDVAKPGFYEIEFGATLHDVIYKLAGGIPNHKKFKTALLGGAAGTFANEKMLPVPLAYETLSAQGLTLGSGAIIVLNNERSISLILENIMRFFAHESCGKCVPCRTGSTNLKNRATQWKNNPDISGLKQMTEIAQLMAKSSLCPLGQSPIFSLNSALKNLESEFNPR